jgi:shikimate dehydrogenase
VTAPVRLAVLGDPLRYSRSPELHRAGAAALGIACESELVRTPVPELAATLARLEASGYTGCNLTMPLKEPALAYVRQATARARRARSVNTITFHVTGSEGDTTDGVGFVELLQALDRDIASCGIVLLGAGGSARSLALAVADAGGRIVGVVSRREPPADAAWGGALGARWCAWGSEAEREGLAAADVVVNCTPLGADGAPAPLEPIARGALVVDLTYGEALTPWVRDARARGLEAVDGLGLLVHQARHSLMRWFDRDVPLAPLAAAVGWPR